MEVASSNSVTVPCFCFDFIYIFIHLSIAFFEYIQFQIILLLNFALMTANSAFPIEFIHFLASRIYVFVFANVSFKGHFC